MAKELRTGQELRRYTIIDNLKNEHYLYASSDEEVLEIMKTKYVNYICGNDPSDYEELRKVNPDAYRALFYEDMLIIDPNGFIIAYVNTVTGEQSDNPFFDNFIEDDKIEVSPLSCSLLSGIVNRIIQLFETRQTIVDSENYDDNFYCPLCFSAMEETYIYHNKEFRLNLNCTNSGCGYGCNLFKHNDLWHFLTSESYPF